MSKTVTFQLPVGGARAEERGRMSVRELIEVLERTLGWLRTLDPESPADWEVVRCKLTPPYSVTLENPDANGALSGRMREMHGFAQPARRTADQLMLPRLSEEEIESTSRLVDLIGETITEVRISSPGEPTVKLTAVVADKVRTIARALKTESHVEWTTVRGTLFEVTASPTVNKFRIKHQLTGSSVVCGFEPDQLEKVKDALPARVEVYGRARMNHMGQPISVDVEFLRKLPAEDISLDALTGIDITGGRGAVEHVERVRGGD